MAMAYTEPQFLVGIDIGSTTVKAAVVSARTREVVFSSYLRHHAHQRSTAVELVRTIADQVGNVPVRIAVTGSGGKELAGAAGVPFVQEVVANSIAVAAHYPAARCAIELGGQDAKMIFFEPGFEPGSLKVSDMRMNGSCAGGTGAFLDEIASLLQIPVEKLDSYAANGQARYSISGRCGVYAKTDIQPLVNQGAAKEDIVRSTFHAMAKQTLGGLAQGLDIVPPVIFEGGPLTFNPTLVDVFAERLGIEGADIIVPDNPETIVARGAALSLTSLFEDQGEPTTAAAFAKTLESLTADQVASPSQEQPFFPDEEACARFRAEHALADLPIGPSAYEPHSVVPVYLGIDSGSTTTKFALLDESGNLVDQFYANNEGEPLDVARRALAQLAERYRKADVALDIRGVATTGYGEMLFARAFHADCHVVETVAHAIAAAHYVGDATFILDIGGQDMKAIWLDGGIVTDILVNEACSSGCGSFLENFAKNLGVETTSIADAAFRSKSPADLGSRCTVFMTSSVVTEQRAGKTPDDIMAGLCRSIIQNVFTKVIRISNLDSLGERIVVQGGTFANDAVLAAFESYVGRPVTRAPYPGLMGAIGAALFAMRQRLADDDAPDSQFIGLEAAARLTFEQQTNVTCPFCANACSRTLITFTDGSTWVTGNRCERGEIVGDIHDPATRQALKQAQKRKASIPNLYDTRMKLLFAEYPASELCAKRGITIGLPRVLALWDSAPFWKTFFTSLGFDVELSRPSTRELYEGGLTAVTSDTVCFPAKLAHGHVRDLERKRVDRIFMPSITTVPSENTAKTSESMCAVVKGYPIVLRNSDNPEQRSNVVFDAPLFHWYSESDRDRQLGDYMQQTFGIDRDLTRRAIEAGDAAQRSFRDQLVDEGRRVIDQVHNQGSFAVVLASRPYHNDPLVNHDLPALFVEQGVAVLTADALPDAEYVDLSYSRLDIVNNYHARMLEAAILSARNPDLEYAQVVSFGCGHDAYLSDEIVRLTHEISDKSPLILKVDESDVPGPLRIRVRSFIETIQMKRAERGVLPPRTLADPYPVKFTKSDRRQRVVLIPNTSHAFSRLMAAAFSKQGIRAVAMDIGRDEAIRLGKKYVHNDICFPAQIVIGEALAELESGKYDGCEVAVGTGKYIGDCRLTHYGALLRKALDDAGYAHVPIITNDDVDAHDLHPGFKMNTLTAARIAMGLPMIDALEELLRKIRPYELVPGSAQAAFDQAIDEVMNGLERRGISGMKKGFAKGIGYMRAVGYDRSVLRPRVLIVGEYLLNFHPGANHDVEQYLEDNGFEIIEAKMTDVIRKTYFYKGAQVREYGVVKPVAESAWYSTANRIFEHAHNVCDRIAAAHPLYEPACRMPQLVAESDPIIHHTFDAGEGVLIPGEIIHHANNGCKSFLILQPFGCLPNHIVGRGIVKRLKELYPDVQILALDYDPDVSFANVENRLQMLVMNAQGLHADEPVPDLDSVAESVVALASEEGEFAEQVLAIAAQYADDGKPITREDIDNTVARMHAVLEQEDKLAAAAKRAITAAREAARTGASDAAENVTHAAVRVYEMARDMRSRTRENMRIASELVAGLGESGSDALTRAQQELKGRIADAQAFAARLLDESGKISGKK